MKNPFKTRALNAFDRRLTARFDRARTLSMIPGIIVDEIREELLLGPHPDPNIGRLALNLPLDFGTFEDEEADYAAGKPPSNLIPFKGPDEDPAS